MPRYVWNNANHIWKMNELIQVRAKLHKLRDSNINSNYCPYCNSQYDNAELLEAVYDSLSIQLKASQSDLSIEIGEKKAS